MASRISYREGPGLAKDEAPGILDLFISRVGLSYAIECWILLPDSLYLDAVHVTQCARVDSINGLEGNKVLILKWNIKVFEDASEKHPIWKRGGSLGDGHVMDDDVWQINREFVDKTPKYFELKK